MVTESSVHENNLIELICSTNCALNDQLGIQSIKSAKRILKQFPDIAQDNLVLACITGTPEEVARLIDAEPHIVNQKFVPRGWPPLLYLCFSRFLRDKTNAARIERIVQSASLLLDAGADPNAYFMLGDEKETCLYGACGVVNCAALAELLLNHGANVDDEDATYHVAEFDTPDCIGVLIDHGLTKEMQATILLRKLDFDDYEGVKYILERGVDPNEPGIWNKTAIHQAIMRGRRLEFCELLFEHGADLEAKRSDGATPLYLASIYGRTDIVDWLKTKGVNETWSAKQTLLAALGVCDTKTAQSVINVQPNIFESLNENEKLALVKSAQSGNLNSVELMLELGFDTNIQDDQGFTALHWAAWYGHDQVVQLLLEHNARLELENNYGGTVIDSTVWGYANSNGCDENADAILKMLADAGADLSRISPFPSGNEKVDAIIESLRT